MITIVIMAFISITCMPIFAAKGEGVTGMVFDGLIEIGKKIDAANAANKNPDLVLGKELEAYKINSKYTVLLSDGSWKNNPCFVFSTYDDKTKRTPRVGYRKGNETDMKKFNDFKQLNDIEKRQFIKNDFLKFAKFDLGEIDAEPATADLNLGKELEAYQINKQYTVKVSDGFFKKNAATIFSAYDQNKRIGGVIFDKNNASDQQDIKDFNQLDQSGKKKQIKDWLLKYDKLDLGPVE